VVAPEVLIAHLVGVAYEKVDAQLVRIEEEESGRIEQG
jgi:hypothetical protein